jgi:plasmid stability protein
MKSGTTRRRGRPPGPESSRRTANLTLRIRDDLKETLEQLATRSGRSLSAETEVRLGQALTSEGLADPSLSLAFGRQAAGLLLLLGRIMREVGANAGFSSTRTLEGATSWMANPYAFDQVAKGMWAAIESVRPEGEIVAPQLGSVPGLDLTQILSQELGRCFARTLLAAVSGEELTADLTQFGALVRDHLGDAAVGRIRARVASGQVGE